MDKLINAITKFSWLIKLGGFVAIIIFAIIFYYKIEDMKQFQTLGAVPVELFLETAASLIMMMWLCFIFSDDARKDEKKKLIREVIREELKNE